MRYIARLTAPLLQLAGRQDIVLQALVIADSFQTANGQPVSTLIPQYVKANNWHIVSMVQGRRGGLAARLGDTAQARVLAESLERLCDSLGLHPRSRRYLLVGRARIESMLGHTGYALELLRAAGTYNYFPPLWFEAEFELLRGNPEYERLMRPKDGPQASATYSASTSSVSATPGCSASGGGGKGESRQPPEISLSPG